MTEAAFLEECEALIIARSSTFHQAFQFLPSPEKEAVFVTYAFCRMIDDSVDEPGRSLYTLEELELGLNRLDHAEGHFIWPAMRWLFDRFPVSKEPFRRQIRGQRFDSEWTHYDTFEQLEQYCYLVAGTVGEMLLPILCGRPVDGRTVQSGIALGKAMQIVNIIRDVGEDWLRGRRYIPLEVMERFGCTEQDFEKGEASPALRDTIDWLASIARDWLRTGLLRLRDYPSSSAFCIELAAHTYMAILDEVVRNQYRVFTERAVVSDTQKLSILSDTLRRYPQVKQEALARLAGM